MLQQENIDGKISIVYKYCTYNSVFKKTLVYQCNGKQFQTEEGAYNYLRLLSGKVIPKYPIEKAIPMESFNIKNYLGSNLQGYIIWQRIWKHCNFKCYSLDHFSIFKQKVVEEINFLRKFHKSEPLKENLKLTKLAQKHAEKIAYVGKLFSSSSWFNPYGETIGATFYLAGSTIVNRWYEESKYYDYKKYRSLKDLDSFTQLVWLSTKYIGVGVVKKGPVLYLVCKFYPKGNIRNKFHKNVLLPQKFRFTLNKYY
ncbi:CAP domain-containing protein [Strongyloides ratti]|uniref:CAP domain-containing protein n=1 Tax=Strongyloides ratti TaxID=34506 RepID=A0A090LD77_STRRB|nr:CAP domain-containing protein [Strongyloides ratti]CEF66098.1 CAP domain-containing protein [Strongyloides ratti]